MGRIAGSALQVRSVYWRLRNELSQTWGPFLWLIAIFWLVGAGIATVVGLSINLRLGVLGVYLSALAYGGIFALYLKKNNRHKTFDDRVPEEQRNRARDFIIDLYQEVNRKRELEEQSSH